MLLKIDFKPEDVVYESKGRIVLKMNYYAAHAIGPHLGTFPGETAEDFQDAYNHGKGKSGKTVFVSTRGTISVE
jgi:hypothetical protein